MLTFLRSSKNKFFFDPSYGTLYHQQDPVNPVFVKPPGGGKGALDLPFIPCTSSEAIGHFQHRSFLGENKYRVIPSPFTGERVCEKLRVVRDKIEGAKRRYYRVP